MVENQVFQYIGIKRVFHFSYFTALQVREFGFSEDDYIAQRLGISLIATDRPGHGLSEKKLIEQLSYDPLLKDLILEFISSTIFIGSSALNTTVLTYFFFSPNSTLFFSSFYTFYISNIQFNTDLISKTNNELIKINNMRQKSYRII